VSGKSRIFTVLILVIAAFAAAGCSPPVMSLGGVTGPAAGYLEVVQTPRSYTVGEVFELNEDHLRVFTVSGARKNEVFPNDDENCEVWVIDYPPDESIRVRADGLIFSTDGIKTIRVWYKNLVPQEYTITVHPEPQVEGGAVGWVWA